MAEQTHTRGPWRFDGDWTRIPTIFGADNSHVATVEKSDFVHGKFPGIGQTISKPERVANARLIAAAPDLSDFASHTQWEVIMGALEKWTKDGGSQLVALGIIGHGLLILDEARRAALARATTPDDPHERGEG